MQGERGEAGAAEEGFAFQWSSLPLKILFHEKKGGVRQRKAAVKVAELNSGGVLNTVRSNNWRNCPTQQMLSPPLVTGTFILTIMGFCVCV